MSRVLPLSSVVENSASHCLKVVYSEVFAVNVWKSKILSQRILRKGDMGGWPTLDGGSTGHGGIRTGDRVRETNHDATVAAVGMLLADDQIV